MNHTELIEWLEERAAAAESASQQFGNSANYNYGLNVGKARAYRDALDILKEQPRPRDEWQELITVYWLPTAEQWRVDARAAGDEEWWSVNEGTTEELDMLLSQARDIATGG